MSDEDRAWWEEQCPERAAGLTHAHWAKCDPNRVHPQDGSPAAGRTHGWDMCCHCELTHKMMLELRDDLRSVTDKELAEAEKEIAIEALSVPDSEPGEDIVCPIDHKAIQPRRVVLDGSVGWTTCVICGEQLEPKMATGKCDGPETAKGRGPLTKRQEHRLSTIAMTQDFNDWLAAGRPPMNEWFRG